MRGRDNDNWFPPSLTVTPAGATPPGLAWTTNIGARVFAIDEQTNLYASAGGNVLVLDASGTVLQTNSICPLPGVARRDAAGNYFYAGSFDGTQNFGGITLVGGWTNHNGQYASGWPTCYAAKYSSNGTLQWVKSFGSQSTRNILTDMVLDPGGGLYAGYDDSGFGARVAHLAANGTLDWIYLRSGTAYQFNVLKLGGTTVSNCCVLNFDYVYVKMFRLDRNANASGLGQYPYSREAFRAQMQRR